MVYLHQYILVTLLLSFIAPFYQKEGPISELQSIASWHSAGASSCRSVVAVHHVQQERLLRLSYQVTAHRGLW